MPSRDGTARDNTGVAFNSRGRRDERQLPHKSIMRNPKLLTCPECGNMNFHIIADDSDHGAAGLVQFRCAKGRCGTVWPELEMHKPQMNDEIARIAQRTPLWLPPVIEDIDVAR